MTKASDMSRLKREIRAMPEDVGAMLEKRGLRSVYDSRPAYQRNDYLSWIGRARRDDTRAKRIDQMLTELERGGVYMKMDWNG